MWKVRFSPEAEKDLFKIDNSYKLAQKRKDKYGEDINKDIF